MTALEEPITFEPLFMERVWGGRLLEERLGKRLPPEVPIGESWELVDRPEAQSVIAGTPGSARTLHDLWCDHRQAVFGDRGARHGSERFPLMIKLLDARETLSVQVHPPAGVAERLGGEPKTEAWYILGAAPDAHLYAGLRDGTTRAVFESALTAGEDVSALLHRFPVTPGDAMFIPSGRVHAIGAGCTILEVQQRSDTTYRVYDFDRPGLDGRPRELHVDAALQAIDFEDVEPAPLAAGEGPIVTSDDFEMERARLLGTHHVTPAGEATIVCVTQGRVCCGGLDLAAGSIALIPACAGVTARTLEPAQEPAEAVFVRLAPARA